MLFQYEELPYDTDNWQRINMRKVSHLIGAEMIHNLYNRYWPRINSLRFRNTVVIFKDGIVDSYAPKKEWDYLQNWLSKKFIADDKILIKEIEAILHPSYDRVDALMNKINVEDFSVYTNEQLALSLIDVMDVTLGEIYKLNVVQVEYSLNFAIDKLLQKYEPNPVDRNELLSTIIAPGSLTAAQKEEMAFSLIVNNGMSAGINDPKHDKAIYTTIVEHHKLYAGMHCAYGEEPPTLESYLAKYIIVGKAFPDLQTIGQANSNVSKQKQASDEILVKLDDQLLCKLANLMSQIGVFRDDNKAKLGETVIIRLQLLHEISRRTRVDMKNLNLYLMSEITTLLESDIRCDSKIISSRKQLGVSFKRIENVEMGSVQPAVKQMQLTSNLYSGTCASTGLVTAPVRLIRTKEDIRKMKTGDIMVAVGTDFDLIEIMYKSGGIITEEGGLLSHASVVSRELEKPCIIGVKDIMQLLNEGQLVELDATNGTIKLL